MNPSTLRASLAGKTVTGGRLNIGNALACDNEPQVVLSAPANGFVAGVNDVIPIKVLGANCAVPAGLGNVTATVNGTPVALSAASPDTGLYTGSYTVTGPGAADRHGDGDASAASTDSETANGNAYPNYTCQDAPVLVGRRDRCGAARRRRRRRCVLDAQHRIPDLVLRADVLDRVCLLERLPHPRVERGSDRPPQRGDSHHRGAQRRDRTVLGRPVPGSERLCPCRGQRHGAEPNALRRVVQRPALRLPLDQRHRSRSRQSSRRTATSGSSTWTRASSRPGIRRGTRAARRRPASSGRTASSVGRSPSTSRC